VGRARLTLPAPRGRITDPPLTVSVPPAVPSPPPPFARAHVSVASSRRLRVFGFPLSTASGAGRVPGVVVGRRVGQPRLSRGRVFHVIHTTTPGPTTQALAPSLRRAPVRSLRGLLAPRGRTWMPWPQAVPPPTPPVPPDGVNDAAGRRGWSRRFYHYLGGMR
jgi:hypothetical protein